MERESLQMSAWMCEREQMGVNDAASVYTCCVCVCEKERERERESNFVSECV